MDRKFIVLFVILTFHLAILSQALAEVTTSINGELRLRPEFRDNADFDETSDDTLSFFGQRTRLGVNAKISSNLNAYIQLQDSRNWGEDKLFTDDDKGLGIYEDGELIEVDESNEKVDIHQGYVVLNNLAGLPLILKIGRQELAYGDQRLVGSFGWGNGRAFDAIKLMVLGDIADVDLWTAKVREDNATSAGSSGEDLDFYGLYSTFKEIPIPDSNLQAYLLYKHDGIPNLSEYTLGARLAGKVASIGFDYSGEFAYQFGDKEDASKNEMDISAYALAVEAGYTIPVPWSPKVALEYDYATGDDDSSDKDAKTFDQLYPTNHILYGYMDYQGWKNMSDITLKVSAKPSEKNWLYLAYHIFSLAEKEDAWYGANGLSRGGFGPDSDNKESSVGSELDLLARHIFNPNLKIEAGVSQFFAGDYIKGKVGSSDVDDSTWAYLMGTVSF